MVEYPSAPVKQKKKVHAPVVHCDKLTQDEIISEYGKSEEEMLKNNVNKTITVERTLIVSHYNISEGKYQCEHCYCHFDETENDSCPFCGSNNFVEGEVIETAEQVIEKIKTDKEYYQEWLEELAINALKNNEALLKSWCDWFNGKTECNP